MNFFKKYLSKFQSELLYIDFAYLSAKIAQSVSEEENRTDQKEVEAADSSPPDRHLQSEQQRKSTVGRYARGRWQRAHTFCFFNTTSGGSVISKK